MLVAVKLIRKPPCADNILTFPVGVPSPDSFGATVPLIQSFLLVNGAIEFVASNAITALNIGGLPIGNPRNSGHHKHLHNHFERLLMRYLIASLLDPVARLLAYVLPGVSGAAVTVTEGSWGVDAWTTEGGFTVKAGGLWLEVDWA